MLIVFQTTLLSGGSQVIPYDLLGPYVVFLGIYRPPREAVPVLLVCGLVMDGISGGVFGIHLTVYLWMYMGVRRAIGYLHAGNVFLLPLLVAAAVAFQSVVMALSALVLSAFGLAGGVDHRRCLPAGGVGCGFTGPFVLLLIKRGMDLVVRARRAFRNQGRRPVENAVTEYLNNVDSDWFSQRLRFAMIVVFCVFVVIVARLLFFAGHRRGGVAAAVGDQQHPPKKCRGAAGADLRHATAVCWWTTGHPTT